MLGCAAESIAGDGEDIEGQPGVSLWAAHLPGAVLEPFQLQFRSTADGLVCDGFPEFSPEATTDIRAMLLLGEPYSCAVDFIIEQLQDMAPGVPLLGGMASGGHGRGQNRLFYQGECIDHGAVGVIIRGGPRIKSIVSQGCRQIGHTYVITKAERNVILELGGKPALMFQEPALYPWLTAAENVELALRLRGVGKKERRERSADLLELVRLKHAGDKRVHELSGGMRQRVAMARALAQDSHVLLMDEPFAALDAITRDVLHEELVRLRESQKLTVLFVTHNVREAVRLGDRVVLLSSRPGRVVKEYAVEIGQPRRIESPEVAALSVAITEDLRTEIRRHGGHS